MNSQVIKHPCLKHGSPHPNPLRQPALVAWLGLLDARPLPPAPLRVRLAVPIAIGDGLRALDLLYQRQAGGLPQTARPTALDPITEDLNHENEDVCVHGDAMHPNQGINKENIRMHTTKP